MESKSFVILMIGTVALAWFCNAQTVTCPSACAAVNSSSVCQLQVNVNKTAKCGTCKESLCFKAVAFFCNKDALDSNCTAEADLTAFKNVSACMTWLQGQCSSATTTAIAIATTVANANVTVPANATMAPRNLAPVTNATKIDTAASKISGSIISSNVVLIISSSMLGAAFFGHQ